MRVTINYPTGVFEAPLLAPEVRQTELSRLRDDLQQTKAVLAQIEQERNTLDRRCIELEAAATERRIEGRAADAGLAMRRQRLKLPSSDPEGGRELYGALAFGDFCELQVWLVGENAARTALKASFGRVETTLRLYPEGIK